MTHILGEGPPRGSTTFQNATNWDQVVKLWAYASHYTQSTACKYQRAGAKLRILKLWMLFTRPHPLPSLSVVPILSPPARETFPRLPWNTQDASSSKAAWCLVSAPFPLPLKIYSLSKHPAPSKFKFLHCSLFTQTISWLALGKRQGWEGRKIPITRAALTLTHPANSLTFTTVPMRQGSSYFL